MDEQRYKKSKTQDWSMKNVIYDTVYIYHGITLFTYITLCNNFATESK
jgi:hypothetical protein